MLGKIRRAFRRHPKNVAPASEVGATNTGHSTVKGLEEKGVGDAKPKSEAGNGMVRSRKLWRKSRRVIPSDAKEEVPASTSSAVVLDKADDVPKGKKTEPIPQKKTGVASILKYSLRVSLACTDLLHLCPHEKQVLEQRIQEQDKKDEEKELSREEKRSKAIASAERRLRDRQRLPGMNAEFVLKRHETDPPPNDQPPSDDTSDDDPFPKTGPRIAWAE